MNERLPNQIFEKPLEDYCRVATIAPEVHIADPQKNTAELLDSYLAVSAVHQPELVATPELSITGYGTADLFFSRHVLDQTVSGLKTLADATTGGPALVVGAPLEKNGLLYNCAVMLAEGKIAGAVPKSHLPNYNEFYEKRWFTSGAEVASETIAIADHDVPFGTDILFDVNGTKVALEVCEDVFAPIPPSSEHALAGAEVLINLSASNELIGKTEYRKRLIAAHAGSLICGYVYTSAGYGESNADVVYGGHQMINETGRLVAEAKPLETESQLLTYDIDRTNIIHDRLLNKTYGDQAARFRAKHNYREIKLAVPKPEDDQLARSVDPHPFVPKSQERLDERCEELFAMMTRPLVQNIKDNNSGAIVIGLSGGLDSTLALLTADYTARQLGENQEFIHTITMPGAASSARTQDNATLLAEALGANHKIIPIDEMTAQTLKAIGHDGVTEDIAYENTQARIRKSLLEDYANMVHGLDLGTGDMSEAAQGWCTFNGDHMSMRNQNAGIPKTLVQHLVRWYAHNRASPDVKNVLLDILDTPISPELTGNGDLSQETEDILGPYELHDFFLYQERRYGTRPNKIGYLATKAFAGAYDEATIKHWLDSYLTRFTSSQWKREAQPNGTKYGTISLSQRGDLRMAPNTSPDWWK